jgi:hypothetical protein
MAGVAGELWAKDWLQHQNRKPLQCLMLHPPAQNQALGE